MYVACLMFEVVQLLDVTARVDIFRRAPVHDAVGTGRIVAIAEADGGCVVVVTDGGRR